MDPASVAALKFCPVASVDVEHSFSQFKHVFSDYSQCFLQENLAPVVIASSFMLRGTKCQKDSFVVFSVKCF